MVPQNEVPLEYSSNFRILSDADAVFNVNKICRKYAAKYTGSGTYIRSEHSKEEDQ